MRRREFIIGSTAALAYPAIAGMNKKVYKVGVIGDTGRGNYGHGLDRVWLDIPQTEIAGVADPVEKGLIAAQRKLKTENGFSDYRKMLATLKPEIVAICPRHPDQHLEMISASILNGAKGIYVEKPFCRSPEEGDKILKLSKSHNCKIAIAHRNRYHPVLKTVKNIIDKGTIGKVLEFRGRGKGDSRGGCVDLWILGSHVLNLINFFGGKALSCSAVIMNEGKEASLDEMRNGEEGLGQILGNRLHARYIMQNGTTAYFDSIANDQTQSQGFGLEIIGSKGVIQFQCDREPLATITLGNPLQPGIENKKWQPISTAGIGKPEPIRNLHKDIMSHIIPANDLIRSIENDGSPICDAEQGADVVEMICAVFASHKEGGKSVEIPLQSRVHPFGNS